MITKAFYNGQKASARPREDKEVTSKQRNKMLASGKKVNIISLGDCRRTMYA